MLDNDIFKGNDKLKTTLKNMFDINKFENMIIVGGECMGKTRLLEYIKTKYLYKKHECLYLDYLDDKGIDMIRNKIKHFTNLKTKTHKFILIDDADDLSTSAQQSLRRIMEEKLKTCTFIFTLNNFKNLIFPIHSRCILYELDVIRDINTYNIYNNTQYNITTMTNKDLYKLISIDELAYHNIYNLLLNETIKNDTMAYFKIYSNKINPYNLINQYSYHIQNNNTS